jgi:UPF0271 protein
MTATRVIDLNADGGESFGRWRLGADEELFQLVTTVNIACGYHAGDPATMRRAVVGARNAGCAIGAHPGYPDLLGFGRRAIPVTDSDTIDYILFQVGALSAIAASEGVTLTHVKPHGSLMGAVTRSPELTVAIASALQAVRPGLPLLIAPSPGLDAAQAQGLPAIPENAADLSFDSAGRNIIEPIPGPKDPDVIAEQALRMANGNVLTVNGELIAMPVKSICVHGDRPNAVELARAVRKRLTESGYQIKSLFTEALAQ